MTKPFGLFVLLVLCISPAMAQDSAPALRDQSAPPQEKPEKRGSEKPRYELSAGYAYRSYYQSGASTMWLNGWYASATYNLWRWLGAEAEGMGVYKDQGIILGKTRIYNFLVGPKLYPFGHRKLTPFGHVLLGAARYSNTVPPLGPYGSVTRTATAYAWEAGGGLDYDLSRHWGVRLIQVDFGSANFFGGSSATTRGNKRIVVGIVYRFGER
jgi:opacity protein-like surface antigen